MDAELKQHLEAMESRMDGKLEAMESRLEGKLDAAEERLKANTRQECEKVETALLTEFHKWGRTSDMRTREALARTPPPWQNDCSR